MRLENKMDKSAENPETRQTERESLTSQQLELVKLSRSSDQVYHSGIEGHSKQSGEINKARYEKEKEYNIRVLNSDLIGFDEDQGRFERGHATRADRRERGGLGKILRGRGAYCVLVDKNTNEYLVVVDFDSQEDKVFVEEKREALIDFMNPRGVSTGGYKRKNVVLISGEQVVL